MLSLIDTFIYITGHYCASRGISDLAEMRGGSLMVAMRDSVDGGAKASDMCGSDTRRRLATASCASLDGSVSGRITVE